MKKVLLSVLSLALIFTVVMGNNANAERKYSGEELFKGFVFAQGEVGEKLPEIFNQATVEELNSPEAKDLANTIVKKIKKEDPTYFDRFQKATYSKNAAEIDRLLRYAGKIIKKDVEEMAKVLGKKGAGEVGSLDTQVSVESYYYYYYAVAAAAAAILVLVVSQIDVTPVAPADDFNREMAIKTLIERVN